MGGLHQTKRKTQKNLNKMELTLFDLIHITLNKVAEDGRSVPFEIEVPNRETRAAMKSLDKGEENRYASPQALFKDLGLKC